MPLTRERAILLAFGFPIQYRALRCAHEAGLDVFVIGDASAACLRYSRFCMGFVQLDDFHSVQSGRDEEIRNLIENCARNWKTSLILPADIHAVALLGRLRGSLTSRVFPVPEPSHFELLDDKWRFHLLCRELGVPVPKSWLFESKEALLASARNGELPEESIVKPTRLWGEIGVKRFRSQSAMEDLASVDYSPLMVQEFIGGVDKNCSVVSIDGQSQAKLAYVDLAEEKRFDCDPGLLNDVDRIARHLRLNGIFNLDTRKTPEGLHYFLECNPRPFMSMHMSAQAGVNCFAVGLERLNGVSGPVVEMTQCTVKKWRGLARTAASPWKLTRLDFRAIRDLLSDPLPLVHEFLMLVAQRHSSAAAPSGKRGLLQVIANSVLSSVNDLTRWLRGGEPVRKLKI